LTAETRRVKSPHDFAFSELPRRSPQRLHLMDRKFIQAMSKFGYLGIFFGVAIVIGLVAGTWVDGRYHTKPWGGLIGLLVGVASGFRELYRVSKRAMRDN
jgi:F0F1-type ATP synthase assembly protein I